MFQVKRFDTVSSTNDIVKAAIKEGAPEGFAACACRQTGGYGRQGRAWSSPAGGMYVSVLLRPSVNASQIPTLSLVAGIAVRRALSSILQGLSPDERISGEVLLKWPNDVIFGDSLPFRKLCGISSELICGAVCLGIGVNVFPPVPEPDSEPALGSGEAFASQSRNTPIYLAELCGPSRTSDAYAYDGSCGSLKGSLSVECVRESVLDELERAYARWTSCGFGAFCDEYDRYSALRGKFVEIEARDGALLCEGKVQGIDDAGFLLLCDSDGKVIRAASGEAHIRQVGCSLDE